MILKNTRCVVGISIGTILSRSRRRQQGGAGASHSERRLGVSDGSSKDDLDDLWYLGILNPRSSAGITNCRRTSTVRARTDSRRGNVGREAAVDPDADACRRPLARVVAGGRLQDRRGRGLGHSRVGRRTHYDGRRYDRRLSRRDRQCGCWSAAWRRYGRPG
jgi:hypothetical protein